MPQRLNYVELAPGGLAAMRGVEHWLNTGTCLSPVLLELVRLRASQLNGCGYCVGMHSHELGKHHEPETRITPLDHWRHSDAYTERERAALAWTEAITNIQQDHVPDEAFQAVREHFSEQETVALTLAIGSIGMWNRMAIAFRAEHRQSAGPQENAGPQEHAGPQEPARPQEQASQSPAAANQPESPSTTAPSTEAKPQAGQTAEERMAVDDDGGKVSVED